MALPIPDIAYDYEHFTLDHLTRILPCAVTRQLGELEYTLLALECYDAGFVATVLVTQDWQLSAPPPRSAQFEQPQLFQGVLLVADAADELGNRYLARVRSGAGGGGGAEGLYAREVHCFAPALDPLARVLTLTLMQVKRPRYDAAGRLAWRKDEVSAGPWSVQFPLNARSEHNAASVSVAPVAQRIAHDDISVTVTTLERFASGFVVNSRVDWRAADGPLAQPLWRATDERGGSYGTGNCAGGGNAAGDNTNTWRMYCQFRPALDPAAATLRLQLAALNLRRAVRNDAQGRFDHWETVRHMTDLGEVVVPLPPPEQP